MHSTMKRIAAAALCLVAAAAPASAKKCGNDSSGFAGWVGEFRKEAAGNGISAATLERALGGVAYASKTIAYDRSQKNFKLSYEQFLQKRGASTIISRGLAMKRENAALFSRLEAKYGVPAGPLIAIWGMETGFGGYTGNIPIFGPLATLAYDCRRSEFFEDQLYSALKILQTGQLSYDQMKGAAHGEIGQMQFLPSNYLKYGADGDGNGRVDMVSSRADALASTANYLKAYGWKPGAGYQPGEPNFVAIEGWNKAQVYQKAIAYIGKEIDG
jgi:lytic murein transglycosylase